VRALGEFSRGSRLFLVFAILTFSSGQAFLFRDRVTDSTHSLELSSRPAEDLKEQRNSED
jgi:uncharacterized protein with von Willebrand factor type A (vWA) domain